MGRFAVSFRCINGSLAKYIENILASKGKIFDIMSKARAIVEKKNKKAAALLSSESVSHVCKDVTGVLVYFPEQPPKKSKKKK